ncbi:hypothetical protein EHI8A_108230 [Entamoeba histolytica HM-1:IMSS-B]|uniref:PH domain-containing protein n=4 Tax=Entamoeba histolytica TaxID=5759 RepID=A0A175JM22_ENTHI|nr:Hypothetical protein EHI5A_099830 [Entamoeba histolytica KU27]EMH75795.1 hypothetical protein EHI8A_108230 [Entamoeba histolytica HM-1:IMSS-B]ENY66014.1 hypothetical protein EHI7A_098100 [Entamoeba histolytica HM-1:IMSS-A]GAT94555.1 hypothetical protein conserved [Entamoeba histolytica]
MSEARLEELRMKTISQINRPYYMEGNVTLFDKKWKKRYLIWKGMVLYFYDKKGSKDITKEVYELSKDTTWNIEFDNKEKKNIIKLKGKSEVIILVDETITLLENGYNQFKQDIETERKRIEIEQSKMKEPILLNWEEVEKRINIKQGKWNSKEVQTLLKELGQITTEKYLYDILCKILNGWNEQEFIDFFYKEYCEEDLEDMGSFLAGSNKDNTTIQFVFGNDEKGAHFIANIYKKIYKQYELVWSEIARCLLVSLASWKLTSKDKMFQIITLDLFNLFETAEIVTFLHFYADYEEELNICLWCSLPEHIQFYLKEITNGWKKDQINSLISMITLMWSWKSDDIEHLKHILI